MSYLQHVFLNSLLIQGYAPYKQDSHRLSVSYSVNVWALSHIQRMYVRKYQSLIVPGISRKLSGYASLKSLKILKGNPKPF